MAIDRVRGMTDIPLSLTGKAEAEHLGMRIQHKGGIHNIMASPLTRTRQTAGAILRHNPTAKMLGTSKGLLPWASGEFEGAPISVVKEEMKHYQRNPDLKFPGVSPFSGVPGESLNQYWKGRLGPHILNRLASLKPGEKAVDLTHYRDIETARAWHKAGRKPDLSLDIHELTHPSKGDTPASLFHLGTMDHPKFEPVDLASSKQLEPGYYMGRHGATEWSKEDNTGEGYKPLTETQHGRHILNRMGLGAVV